MRYHPRHLSKCGLFAHPIRLGCPFVNYSQSIPKDNTGPDSQLVEIIGSIDFKWSYANLKQMRTWPTESKFETYSNKPQEQRKRKRRKRRLGLEPLLSFCEIFFHLSAIKVIFFLLHSCWFIFFRLIFDVKCVGLLRAIMDLPV